ncbi:helix-turn-helix transcriptional regulator [Frankia sp. AgB1.8]|uniref:helix-turn-helix domain-containing protein n=1 Tax=Frankia sp. AgB1.8 TaxID=2792839 RepID=UPI0019341B98|nr:helix-turn-helix transcriptional regulator [Frankia sp. AgB1.8]
MAESGEAPPLLRRLVGDALRGYRTDQGRTLRDVAGAARVSVPYLSEVERGRKEASSEVLAAVCKGLDVRLSDLLEQVRRDLLALETRRDPVPGPRRRAPGPTPPAGGGAAAAAAAPGAAAARPAATSAPLRRLVVIAPARLTPAQLSRPSEPGPTCQLGASLPMAGPRHSIRPGRHRRRPGRAVAGRTAYAPIVPTTSTRRPPRAVGRSTGPGTGRRCRAAQACPADGLPVRGVTVPLWRS